MFYVNKYITKYLYKSTITHWHKSAVRARHFSAPRLHEFWLPCFLHSIRFFAADKRSIAFVPTPTNVSKIACAPAIEKIKINGMAIVGMNKYPSARKIALHTPAHQ